MQELQQKAASERQRCSRWLQRFMQNGQPKFLTKDELRAAAIEMTGRHDWYEPVRGRMRAKN